MVQSELGRLARLMEIGFGDLSVFNVGVELLDVHDGDSSEDESVESGCLKG